MHAAVVTSFDAPPGYLEVPDPVPKRDGEIVVDVVAAGLHRLVRAKAAGLHYSSTAVLPQVAGADGVARMPDGSLRYFVADGAMAQRAVIDPRRSFELPAGADAVQVAAATNPAMSAWMALRRRSAFAAGNSVLVLGATGSSGLMAVQVAKLLGASRVVGAGRNPDRLAEAARLGADATIALGAERSAADIAAAADSVDVVLDYLWGEVAAQVMTALAVHRADPDQPLRWVQIGGMAGTEAAVAAAVLRKRPFEIVGSGFGSIPDADFLAELPELITPVCSGALQIAARPVPLSEVERNWADTGAGPRTVFLPRA